MEDQDKQIGEGSYEGARDYRARTETFLAKDGESVDAKAREAAAALDGKEGEALRAAEEEGRSHAAN